MIHTGRPGGVLHAVGPLQRALARIERASRLAVLRRRASPRAELLAQRNRVVARHPKTTFICAHLANNGEDLAEVGRWLDTYPNMYVEIDARISELGRQPYSARRFFFKYQDRVMFGTDTPPDRAAYRIYYRFLETDDEYFDPSASHHLQGFWMIYGVFLPEDVLEKIYHQQRRAAPARPRGEAVTLISHQRLVPGCVLSRGDRHARHVLELRGQRAVHDNDDSMEIPSETA